MHTDFLELAAVASMSPVDSSLIAERHVAWDWAQALSAVAAGIGNVVVWVADSFDGNECYGERTLETSAELYAACESAESIRAIDGNGNPLTPTIFLG